MKSSRKKYDIIFPRLAHLSSQKVAHLRATFLGSRRKYTLENHPLTDYPAGHFSGEDGFLEEYHTPVEDAVDAALTLLWNVYGRSKIARALKNGVPAMDYDDEED